MPKVLVITGDATFGERLVKVLQDAQYDAAAVNDGAMAMNAITNTLPHLILLDVILPNITGYDILSKKIAEPLLAKIPVFLMSTQGTPINMRLVPQGSISKFIVALHADPLEIVDRVNEQFGRKAVIASSIPTKDQKIILWVEDDKLIGNILGKKLISSGFNLIHTKNGEEALSKLQEIMPHAILIDLLLPGMSGFDILQNIRSNPKFKAVPIMILSNLSKPSDIDKAKALGAQKFLIKATASLDQIVAEVRALVK
jgi:adenylate cyclase